MRVVLLKQVNGLGNRGDIVDVANGYARNYLVPSGKAQRATDGIENQAESMRKSWQHKNAKDREAAEEVAKSLVAKIITISARASGEGKLFGSVSVTDILDAVTAQTGVELDRKMLDFSDGIKTLGSHSVTARPHPDVEFPITVEVKASE